MCFVRNQRIEFRKLIFFRNTQRDTSQLGVSSENKVQKTMFPLRNTFHSESNVFFKNHQTHFGRARKGGNLFSNEIAQHRSHHIHFKKCVCPLTTPHCHVITQTLNTFRIGSKRKIDIHTYLYVYTCTDTLLKYALYVSFC